MPRKIKSDTRVKLFLQNIISTFEYKHTDMNISWRKNAVVFSSLKMNIFDVEKLKNFLESKLDSNIIFEQTGQYTMKLLFEEVSVPETFQREQAKERVTPQPAQEKKAVEKKDSLKQTVKILLSYGIGVHINQDAKLDWCSGKQQKIALPCFTDPKLLEDENFVLKIKHSIGFGPSMLPFHIELASCILRQQGYTFTLHDTDVIVEKDYPEGRSKPFQFKSSHDRDRARDLLETFLNVQRYSNAILVLPRTRKGVGNIHLSIFLGGAFNLPGRVEKKGPYHTHDEDRGIIRFKRLDDQTIDTIFGELKRSYPKLHFWKKGKTTLYYV